MTARTLHAKFRTARTNLKHARANAIEGDWPRSEFSQGVRDDALRKARAKYEAARAAWEAAGSPVDPLPAAPKKARKR